MNDTCTKCGREVPDWSQLCGCAQPAPSTAAPQAATCSPLHSSDGAFTCTPDHAVQVAYMANLAEGILQDPNTDRIWISELLLSYLEGTSAIEDAIAELREAAGAPAD